MKRNLKLNQENRQKVSRKILSKNNLIQKKTKTTVKNLKNINKTNLNKNRNLNKSKKKLNKNKNNSQTQPHRNPNPLNKN